MLTHQMASEAGQKDEEDRASGERELAELREPPDGPKPELEPQTALQELPFIKLTWSDFEKLIERLAELEGDTPEYVSRFGVQGDEQSGIDIYSRLRSGGGYVVYQCKRYKDLDPADIRKAVDEFLKNKWAQQGDWFAGRFVFCTSHAVASRKLADEIETQAKRLRDHSPPITFVPWGQEALSKKLKSHPDLVEDFFGPSFVDLFVPGGSRRKAESLADVSAVAAEVVDAIQGQLGRRLVVRTLSWAPEILKQVLEQLAAENDTAFVSLTDLVGDPPRIETVLANIETPAAWLSEAPPRVWQALALMAESKGEWASSAEAWQEAAERWADDGYREAGDLVSAAASMNMLDRDDRRTELLGLARARYSRHPRLLLEEVRDLPPREQLAELADVELREPVDLCLIEAQRALACLLVPDLDEAQEHVKNAREALPGSAAGDSVRVNLAVQRARLNQIEGANQHADTLREANREALRLRDGMLRQRRWGEAGRLLMLAADALGLQMEFEAARELLRQATPEERGDPDAAEVLGPAAIRALGAREALELTENAATTDGVRSTRAIATLELTGSTMAQRTQAIADLDEIVAGGGMYATEAAFARLIDAMLHGNWSDAAEQLLRDGGHERPALVLRAFYLGERRGDWEGAYALFDDYEDRTWTLPARLRIAFRWGRTSVLKKAADDLMAEGPGQGLKLECGRAYGKTGMLARAREVLADVARDTTAPPMLRTDAYRLLVVTAVRQEDWKAARRFLHDWVKLRPGDTRASVVAPTIYSRLRQQG
jgi:hypothetical protein